MPDLTLMEKIKKYASITNTINIPREEDKELFDRIMAKDSVFRYDDLDLAELRQLANELKNAEIEAIVKYYTGIAYDMGIDVIDSEQYKSNNDNSIGTEVAENSKESSLDCSEREDSNSEQIERDKESKEIKRSNHITIELGESTIQRLSGILREKSCKNKEDAVQTITFDIIEDEEEYTIEDRNNVVIGISFEEVKGAAYKGLNILYRGVPGCGKTYAAKCDARALIGLKNSNRILQIDFSEDLDSSDTMVGLRQAEDGKWRYIKGEIAKFCELAEHHQDKLFVLILNELTRANTETVLGPMFTAMENKYRGDERKLSNGERFVCPKNVIILATMNSVDQGVKNISKATEDRFYTINVEPLWEVWKTDEVAFNKLISLLKLENGSDEYIIVKQLCSIMAKINKACDDGGVLTKDYKIGQRQLLQYVGEKDILGNDIIYNKETLRYVVKQLIYKAEGIVDYGNEVESALKELQMLLRRCYE